MRCHVSSFHCHGSPCTVVPSSLLASPSDTLSAIVPYKHSHAYPWHYPYALCKIADTELYYYVIELLVSFDIVPWSKRTKRFGVSIPTNKLRQILYSRIKVYLFKNSPLRWPGPIFSWLGSGPARATIFRPRCPTWSPKKPDDNNKILNINYFYCGNELNNNIWLKRIKIIYSGNQNFVIFQALGRVRQGPTRWRPGFSKPGLGLEQVYTKGNVYCTILIILSALAKKKFNAHAPTSFLKTGIYIFIPKNVVEYPIKIFVNLSITYVVS